MKLLGALYTYNRLSKIQAKTDIIRYNLYQFGLYALGFLIVLEMFASCCLSRITICRRNTLKQEYDLYKGYMEYNALFPLYYSFPHNEM